MVLNVALNVAIALQVLFNYNLFEIGVLEELSPDQLLIVHDVDACD